MKKIFTVIFVVCLLIFAGCDDSGDKSASVRFQNNMTDGNCILNGIRLGGAQYMGSLCPGNVTSYYEVNEGSYVVQLYNGSDWVTDTSDKFPVSGGANYTLVIMGTVSYYWYQLINE